MTCLLVWIRLAATFSFCVFVWSVIIFSKKEELFYTITYLIGYEIGTITFYDEILSDEEEKRRSRDYSSSERVFVREFL